MTENTNIITKRQSHTIHNMIRKNKSLSDIIDYYVCKNISISQPLWIVSKPVSLLELVVYNHDDRIDILDYLVSNKYDIHLKKEQQIDVILCLYKFPKNLQIKIISKMLEQKPTLLDKNEFYGSSLLQTILWFTCQDDRYSTIEVLLELGANPKMKPHMYDEHNMKTNELLKKYQALQFNNSSVISGLKKYINLLKKLIF